MKNKRLLHPKEAASALGVSMKTIHRWDEAGKLRTVRTVGNQRRIPLEEIVRLRRQRGRAVERCVLYARVSSVRQERDGKGTWPDRQHDFGKQRAHVAMRS